jgi:enoyl-CoA hydratase/carnithine racemase
MSAPENRISVEIKDGVADVTLTRGDKMNALDPAMFKAIIETGERLKTEKGLRAVVLSGEGRAFCAGLDMGNFAKMGDAKPGDKSGGSPVEGRLAKRTRGLANDPQYAAWVWHEIPVPVIAAVHGAAFGGGFQIQLGADMRYAAPATKLCVMEIKWGLVPDMAGTPLMRQLMRDDVIRELSYTGRIFLAEEGKELGVVTRICDDPKADAMETAREIASKNPDAIRAMKRMYNQLPDASFAEGLMTESVEQDELIGSANQIEAVMAQMQNRAPNFKD